MGKRTFSDDYHHLPLFDILLSIRCHGSRRRQTKVWLLNQTVRTLDSQPSRRGLFFLALRAQTNQVEQLPGFLVGALSFSILVNGTVGAVLSLIWAVLRRIYASRYRSAMGQTIKESKIGNFTIPAYFALNAMLMGTAVHCARLILS